MQKILNYHFNYKIPTEINIVKTVFLPHISAHKRAFFFARSPFSNIRSKIVSKKITTLTLISVGGEDYYCF